MKRNQVRLPLLIFNYLHQFIVDTFLNQHPGDYPEYALYGYNEEKDDVPSIRKAIVKKFETSRLPIPRSLTKKSEGKEKLYISGKYLRDKYKGKKQAEVEIHKDYLQLYLFYIGFDSLEAFQAHLREKGYIDVASLVHTPPGAPSDQRNVTEKQFTCYYFSKKDNVLRYFKLSLNDHAIILEKSPEKIRYTGHLKSQTHGIPQYLCFHLSAQDAYLKSEFTLIINSTRPLDKCLLATGHYYETEGSSGSLIIESEAVSQVMEKIKELSWPTETSNSYEVHFEQFQKDLGPDWAVIRSFFSRNIQRQLKHKFYNGEINNYQQLSQEIKRIKDAFYAHLLYRKQLEHKRIPVNDFSTLEDYLNLISPGWTNNLSIQKCLARKYVAYLASFKRNESGKEEKYLEQYRIDLHSNGSALLASPDSGTFKGYYNVVDQRIVMVRLKKLGSDACYYLILDIPNDIQNHDHNDQVELVIKGVMGGISTSYKPRAEKIMLRSLKDGEEMQVTPRLFRISSDPAATEQLLKISVFEKLQHFFSLRAEDDFYTGGNLLFSNILDLPSWSNTQSLTGKYYYYRVNQKESAVRRYPMIINSDGDVEIGRKDFILKGKAHLFNERAIIHLFDNGQKGYDGTMFFQFPKKTVKQMKGIMLSASSQDECFSNLVWIEKREETETLKYLSLPLDAHPLKIKEISEADFSLIKATYLHFFQNAAILTRESELYAIHHGEEEKYLKPTAITNQLDQVILLLLKGQAHFEEHAARIIKRMVNGWNCTATDILIEKHLNEYKHLDPKIRTQIFMLFNKMKYKKEADLDGGEDLMYLRDNLNKLSRPARSKNT